MGSQSKLAKIYKELSGSVIPLSQQIQQRHEQRLIGALSG